MSIKNSKDSGTGVQHLMSLPATKIAIGAATGGLGGAALAAVPSNSPGGQALAMYRMAQGFGGDAAPTGQPDIYGNPNLGVDTSLGQPQPQTFEQPELGAMFRRAGRNPNLGVNYGG